MLRQEATRELWPKLAADYEPHVSVLVREEASRGNAKEAGSRLRAIESFPTLEADEAAKSLAAAIIAGGGVPEQCPEDALHVAIAAVNGMDILLTWNFAHLNNPFTRMMVRQAVENAGYRCPEVCSPDELLEASDD